MFTVAKGVWNDVESAAKEMIAANKTIAPLLSPGGSPMFYMSTDKSELRIAFMETDVDGTKVFVGIPVGK